MRKTPDDTPASPRWTFLTNHALVLMCLAEDPDARLVEIARNVGITGRAVQKIVVDLDEAGVIERSREGRRNHYRVNFEARLRHPLAAGIAVADLLATLGGVEPPKPVNVGAGRDG